MTVKYSAFLLIFCVASCLSHDDNLGVKGGRSQQHGIKSYGGYAPSQSQGAQAGAFAHTADYHQQVQPNYYQPYGWNYNQPTRTYGKFIDGRASHVSHLSLHLSLVARWRNPAK